MMTLHSRSIASAARPPSASVVPKRGISTFSLNSMSSGVSAMLSATTAMTRPTTSCPSTPFWRAKDRRTKANSPPCARAKEKRRFWSVPMRKTLPRTSNTTSLTSDEGGDEAQQGSQLAADQLEVDGRSDRDEEQPEQQALERLDVALELVAVLGVGEHDAGDEGPEGGAQPDLRHQERDPDHEEQGARREHLPQAALRQGAKHGSQPVTA